MVKTKIIWRIVKSTNITNIYFADIDKKYMWLDCITFGTSEFGNFGKVSLSNVGNLLLSSISCSDT